MDKNISQATLDRMPIYYRTLCAAEENGVVIISSQELGKILNLTPEKIRKDLTLFGHFGKKSLGYYVSELKSKIENILGLQYQLSARDIWARLLPTTKIFPQWVFKLSRCSTPTKELSARKSTA